MAAVWELAASMHRRHTSPLAPIKNLSVKGDSTHAAWGID
jgi:hypothetical protein